MRAEATSPVELEQEKSSPPTTLHLFRYKGSERSNLEARASAVLQLEENFSRTDLSLTKLSAAKNARLNRLSQTVRELSEQLDNTKSSIACDAVYLKMRAELPNLSPNDFMEFFNLCLRINTLLNKEAIDSVGTRGPQVTLLRSLSRMNARRISLENDKMLNSMNMIPDPPEWFSGNKSSWRMSVVSHANFTIYLNPDFTKGLATRPSSIIKESIEQLSKGFYGPTKEGEFPDWLLEGSEILPTKEEVEQELAEDKEQEIKTVNALEKIKEQGDYLITAFTDKTQKAVERLSDLAKETFPNIKNFADMILFAKAADTKTVHLNISNGALEQVVKFYTSPENVLTNQEPIALYIEKKLLEGKIIQSTQDLIDANFTDLFTGLLESIRDKEGSSANQFRDLRETNKKAFGALNYDLKPFLQILPADEISLLEDLLAGSKDKPIELFIWDMAGLISSRFKKEEIQLTQPQLGALYYLSRFTATFLRSRSKFAYEELAKSSHNLQEQEELKPKDSLVTANLQKEIESATDELAKGNLAGWDIFYTDNKTADPDHLSKIEGESLEEREEALQKYFHYNNISSSIKTGSIIRALEWITVIPQEIEQLRMTKEIAGEVFKKVKRGNLRIFYILDAAQKKIIFFTHQKKAWSYGF